MALHQYENTPRFYICFKCILFRGYGGPLQGGVVGHNTGFVEKLVNNLRSILSDGTLIHKSIFEGYPPGDHTGTGVVKFFH